MRKEIPREVKFLVQIRTNHPRGHKDIMRLTWQENESPNEGGYGIEHVCFVNRKTSNGWLRVGFCNATALLLLSLPINPVPCPNHFFLFHKIPQFRLLLLTIS